MAGYGKVILGEGIASIQMAYVDGSGTRVPSSGYSTYTRNTGNIYADHIYVYSLEFESGYGPTWYASYDGYYDPTQSRTPASGDTTTANIHFYPTYPHTDDIASITLEASSSGGGDTDYDYVTMTIRIDNAIKYLELYIINPDGSGDYVNAYDRDSFDVQPGSTQQITNIYLDGTSDYGNPLWCSGSSTFQVTNANGGFVDQYLSMEYRDKTFTFYGTEKVMMTVECGTGVASAVITYYKKDGTATSKTFTGTQSVEVLSGSTQTITSISLVSGYNHPVWCEGDTEFQVTYTNGNFADSSLSMGSVSKTFRLYIKTSSGDGGVQICTGKDADGNPVWTTATPYIWTGSAWVQATPYIYTESGWTQTS